MPGNETGEVLLKVLSERIENINTVGCSHLKLHEQRMGQMDDSFKELKHNIEVGFSGVSTQITELNNKVASAILNFEEKNTKKFDRINNLIIGIMVLTLALAFMAGVNIWEIVRNYLH